MDINYLETRVSTKYQKVHKAALEDSQTPKFLLVFITLLLCDGLDSPVFKAGTQCICICASCSRIDEAKRVTASYVMKMTP